MLKREDIDRFYREVETLNLKFPVAEIARQTGHSKANVSKYLSRKLEPSESFLIAFNGKFQKRDKKVSRETDSGEVPADYMTTKDDLISLLKKENVRLEKELINLKSIEADVIAVSGMNMAILEILMILASEKKTFYNRCIEVLKKYELEGSFL